MLNWILSGNRQDPDDRKGVKYQEARAILERQDHVAKIALAETRTAQPEVLYYLASDASVDIRRRIVENPATPSQAYSLMAHDTDDEIRGELARKIARLLPDMPEKERSTVRDRIIETMEILAQDQLPRVRAILSEELKSATNAPRHIILKLAHDVEEIVAAPVLEYSPLLGDDDLREIIAASTAKGALVAIARRRRVSETVADSIAASLDIPAVAALLANPNAQIREETLDMIAEQSERVREWQEPITARPNLSVRTMRRLACFVAASLIDIMIENNKLEAKDAQLILKHVRERIQTEPIGQDDEQSIARTVANLFAHGAIDDKFILNAIQDRKREAVIQALALLSQIGAEKVRKIIAERDGRKITALSWKSGLAMRTAYQMQVNLAFVPATKILNARNGFDYPLTPAQMAALMEPYL